MNKLPDWLIMVLACLFMVGAPFGLVVGIFAAADAIYPPQAVLRIPAQVTVWATSLGVHVMTAQCDGNRISQVCDVRWYDPAIGTSGITGLVCHDTTCEVR